MPRIILDPDYPLTEKQQQFCDHYLANGLNGSTSYLAIYKVKNRKVASVQASYMLDKANIAAYIRKKQQELSEKTMLDAAWVLQRFKDISDRCMTAVPVMEFDPVEKQMVQKTAINDEGEQVGVYMFDSNGANKATEAIGKHLGFFEVDNKQRTPSVSLSAFSNDELANLAKLQMKAAKDSSK